MRGAPDVGLIQNRNEVEPHGEGYRGVRVIQGQGRWQTPEAPTKAAAQILLDTLNSELTPKPKGDGISDQQRQDMKAALTKWQSPGTASEYALAA
jgi:hypothetical protein